MWKKLRKGWHNFLDHPRICENCGITLYFPNPKFQVSYPLLSAPFQTLKTEILTICRLGSPHDSDGNSCPNGAYIMSSYGFFPNSTTKDTVYRFSVCSAALMNTHLSRYRPFSGYKNRRFADFLVYYW